MSTFDKRRTQEETWPFLAKAITVLQEAVEGAMFADQTPVVGQVAGGIRRNSETVGDIDVVFVTEQYLNAFPWPEWLSLPKRKAKKAYGWITIGDERMMLDVWRCEPESKGPMLLFLTGPPQLNIVMRKRATDHGMLLNQYGLWEKDPRLSGDRDAGRLDENTEESIFEVLDMPVIAPAERDRWESVWKEKQ